MGRVDACFSIADLRSAARRRLPRGVFEFIDRGVEDEIATRANRAAFERINLVNRVLLDVDGVDLSTEVFGKTWGMPLAISPTGLAGFAWHEGELTLARAAAKAAIPYTLANGSITAMEKLAREAGGNLWFQIYIWRERELTYSVVRRAHDAGFSTLVVTVDTGLGGNREHNKRNGFGVPFKLNRRNIPDLIMSPGWLLRVMLPYVLKGGLPRHENYPAGFESIFAATGKGKSKAMRGENTHWEDLAELRQLWPGKLLIKGILHPADARRAVTYGIDGVVVSNHGGRSMDCTAPTLLMLPLIVDAVGKQTTVLIDSGVRRGSDIVKALALGAHGVMAGRAPLYGLAVGGEAGATRALDLIRGELRQTMGYTGCLDTRSITRDVLAPWSRPPRTWNEEEDADAIRAWAGQRHRAIL
jgi:isopentenyl diphosphate isomerase/L-lactate dehydrogenase-like FMN-dependent dehydrogenase